MANGRTQYRILLNCTRSSQFFRLERYCHLELAYVGYLPGKVSPDRGSYMTDFDACEALYRTFNVEHPANYLNRSLSMADVVTLADVDTEGRAHNHRSYTVNLSGFSRLAEPQYDTGIYNGATLERNT